MRLLYPDVSSLYSLCEKELFCNNFYFPLALIAEKRKWVNVSESFGALLMNKGVQVSLVRGVPLKFVYFRGYPQPFKDASREALYLRVNTKIRSSLD